MAQQQQQLANQQLMKSLLLEYCNKIQCKSLSLSAATSPQQLTTSSKGTSNQSPKLEKKTQRGSKQYSCSTCGKLFSTPGYLETHQRLHSGEKPYMCPICGRKFAQRPGYTYHMRTHSGDKRYQCKVCEKSFIQIGTIKRHCETHDLTNCKVDDLIIKLDETEKPIPKPLGRMSKTRRAKEKRIPSAPTVPEVMISAPPPPLPPTPSVNQLIHNQQVNQLRHQYAQYHYFIRQSQLLHLPFPFQFPPRPFVPSIFAPKPP